MCMVDSCKSLLEKKSQFKLISAMIIVLLFFGFVLIYGFAGGTGTSGNPYLISNCTHLQNMESFKSSYFRLTGNINCDVSPYNTGSGFNPIGTFASGVYFTGGFDGNGYNISNLYISRTGIITVGLFGVLYTAEVSDLNLIDINIIADDYAGGLVGYSYRSNIDNVYVSGNLSAAMTSGALIGVGSYSNVSNVEFNTNVSCSDVNCGGLIGQIQRDSRVENVVGNSYVSSSKSFIGGVIGSMFTDVMTTTIKDVNVTSYINSLYVNSSGGVVGSCDTDCYVINTTVNTQIYGNHISAGGIVGYLRDGYLYDSSAISNIEGESDVGGVVGSIILSNVRNVSAIGNITGSGQHTGGIVGYHYFANLKNANFSGDVQGVNSTGGIVGRAYFFPDIINAKSINTTVNGTNLVGGIYGSSEYAEVFNSTFYGNVTGVDFVGGAAGYTLGSDFYYTNVTTQKIEGNFSVGGFTGNSLNAEIYSCRAISNIINATGNGVGGFSGSFYGDTSSVNDTIVINNIIAGADAVGGFFGSVSQTPVNNANSTSNNISGNIFVGGFAGFQTNYSIIDNAISIVNVTGSEKVGGFAGEVYDYAEIHNSEVYSNVYNYNGDNTGGFVGSLVNESVIVGSTATGDIISDFNNVGGFAGYVNNLSYIKTSIFNGSVIGKNNTGGLVGEGRGIVYFNFTRVYANVTGEHKVGGIVGILNDSSTINSSVFDGNVTATTWAGGIAGRIFDNSYINYSKSSGYVESTGRTGGIAGDAWDSSIEGSYSSAIIKGDISGGIVGLLGRAYVNNSYSSGFVNGTSNAGGVAGELYDSIVYNSYSISDVEGDDMVGGLVGYQYYLGFGFGELTSTNNSFFTGNVTGSGIYAGAFLGRNNNAFVANSYWNNISSNFNSIGTDNNGQTVNVRDNETHYFYLQENEPLASWNLEIWDFSNPQCYPFLFWMDSNPLTCFSVFEYNVITPGDNEYWANDVEIKVNAPRGLSWVNVTFDGNNYSMTDNGDGTWSYINNSLPNTFKNYSFYVNASHQYSLGERTFTYIGTGTPAGYFPFYSYFALFFFFATFAIFAGIGNIRIRNKRGLSTIVSSLLFVTVAVVSIGSVGVWLSNYSSDVQLKTLQYGVLDDNNYNIIGMKNESGKYYIYVKSLSQRYIIIDTVKINTENCHFGGANVLGFGRVSKIEVDCSAISSKNDVVIISDSNLLSKQVLLE